MDFTVIIPAYNESGGISPVIDALREHLSRKHPDAQIVVVNDGSTDDTGSILECKEGITLITHSENRGYGASIKTGVRAAQTQWCITYDADGQHTPDLLDTITQECHEGNDLIVGKRDGYKGPWIRQPGKRLIHAVAEFLVERKIPDLNSGLRAFRRKEFMRYMHLFPSGFSISTTSTVCYLKQGMKVAFVPITIKKRTGKSTVRPRDGLKMFMFILRLVMLFSPLRIFLPISMTMVLLTIGLLSYELTVFRNVSDSAAALLSLTAILFFFGLLADQIAAIRREISPEYEEDSLKPRT